MSKNRLLFLSLLLFVTHSIFPALIQGTLIKIPTGLIPIEQLCVGDAVLSLEDNQIIHNRVSAIRSKIISHSYEIITPTTFLRVSPNQCFYDPEIKQYVPAFQLTPHTKFLDANGNYSLCLSCSHIEQDILVYELSLNSPHTFFVTQAGIVVHNFAPVIGISLGWGGKIAIESIVLGLGALGIKFFKDQQQNTKVQMGVVENLIGSSGGSPEDPDKKKHPYGKYEDASYHHANSKGKKSPCPKNGQAALDNSWQIKSTSSTRIAIENGEFVVLERHGDGLFHGHIRTWKELDHDMRALLQKKRLVNKRGKII